MKRLKILVLLTIVFVCNLFIYNNLWAQEVYDWDNFEDDVSGQQNHSKFLNVSKLSYYADTLPSWFFSLPSDEVSFYAVGISDPDMLPDEAKTLAMHRAKAMAVLLSDCKVQYIRDIYSSVADHDSYSVIEGRFDTYFKITGGNEVFDGMFAVVDTYFTRFNEYMVLLKYLPDDDFQFDVNISADAPADSTVAKPAVRYINVVGTAFMVEASVNSAFEQQAEYELLSYDRGAQTQKGNFVYREKANHFLSTSFFNDEPIDFPLYSYIYASPEWTKLRSPFSCYNGLWSIYMRQFMRQFSISCENNSVRMKNTDQQYGEQLAHLTREIASFTAELRINGINFDSDTLKFDFNLLQK